MTIAVAGISTGTVPAGGTPRTSPIPVTMFELGLINDSSKATDCFAKQEFSGKLQAYMCGYVNTVMRQLAIYK